MGNTDFQRGAYTVSYTHLDVYKRQDPDIALIEFLDDKGMNIDKATERRIENAFFSEDFTRVSPDDIGEVAFLTRLMEEYLDCLLETISVDVIREKQFKVVVDYDPGNLSLLLPSFLSALGCTVSTSDRESNAEQGPRHLLDKMCIRDRICSATSVMSSGGWGSNRGVSYAAVSTCAASYHGSFSFPEINCAKSPTG